jgi:hypothetical protein
VNSTNDAFHIVGNNANDIYISSGPNRDIALNGANVILTNPGSGLQIGAEFQYAAFTNELKSQITVNETDIDNLVLETNVNTLALESLESKNATQETSIIAINTELNALDTTVASHTNTIASHTTSINNNTTSLQSQQIQINALNPSSIILTSCVPNWNMFGQNNALDYSSTRTSGGQDYSLNIGNEYKTVLTQNDAQLFSSSFSNNLLGGWIRGSRRIRLYYEINVKLRHCQITALKSRIQVTNNNQSIITNPIQTSLYQGVDLEFAKNLNNIVHYSGELTLQMEDGYRVFLSSYWDILTSSSASGPFECDCKFYIVEL